MDKSSIEEAIKALRLATSELEKIKEKQRIAEENVKAASIELEKSTIKKNELEKNLSSSGQYSNASFWNQRYKEIINNIKHNDDNNDNITYEWYVSFDDIKLKINRDILDADTSYSKSIMVSGCGNSTLCEDLEKYGFTNIIGTDYSKEAIDIMNQRAHDYDYKCHYVETDVCNMRNIGNNSYNVVIDKGTLDAIASANDENDTAKSLAAVHGYISEVWRVLVLQGKFIVITTMPEDVFESIAISTIDTVSVSNWKDCIKESMKTQMGGEVYYYCITKTANLRKSLPSGMSQKDVMHGIQSLLDDAVKARNEFYVNAESVEFQEALNGKEDTNMSTVQPSDTGTIPTSVSLSIKGQSSSIKANAKIEVEYILKNGDWDDRDQICLVCVSNLGTQPKLYNENESQKYEYFEYTNRPEKRDEHTSIGNLDVTLPPYGGYFILSYMRGSKELAKSLPFSILCPVQPSHPDLKLNNSVRRRGVNPIDSTLNMIAEDLKNIKCLQISGIVSLCKEDNSTHHISRIMSWLYKEPSADTYKLILEGDIICVANKSNTRDEHVISKKTIYGMISIQNMNTNNLFIDEAYCEVDVSGRIVCRIPYQQDLKDASDDIDAEKNIFKSENFTEIYCRYCNHLLLNAKIEETRHLPSGILDNMMHEFFCCEELPLQAMSSSELVSTNSSVILGSIQVTVHPSNVERDSLVLTCKTVATLIDLVHGYAGKVATSNSKTSAKMHDGCISCLSRGANLIDVDTCLLSCSRCYSYLGDGCIYTENNDSNENEETSKSSSFLFEDLQNIRLALHCIKFIGNDLKSIDLSSENVVTRTLIHFTNAYSVISFCLFVGDDVDADTDIIVLKVLSKEYDVLVNDTNLLFPPNDTTNNANTNDTIRNYNGLKVLYSSCKQSEVKDNNICKLPLRFDDLHMIESLLSYRRKLFGTSPIKNFNVSCLLAN